MDIVEIDPAVYKYALEHFNMPTSRVGIVFLDDVFHILERGLLSEKYDYILHDVFSGGSQPFQLYTASFFEKLKRFMTSDGVLALNFYGHLVGPKAQPTQSVLEALEHVWTYVRCFSDEHDRTDTSAHNMVGLHFNGNKHWQVFFAADNRIRWDAARLHDTVLQDNSIRTRMLQTFQEHEVDIKANRADTLVASLHDKLAIDHWKAMRKLFSADFWIHY